MIFFLYRRQTRKRGEGEEYQKGSNRDMEGDCRRILLRFNKYVYMIGRDNSTAITNMMCVWWIKQKY